MTFRIEPEGPIPVILIGAGFWGGQWLQALPDAPSVTLVGFVDQVQELIDAQVAEYGLEGVVTGASLAEVAAATGAVAVINATPPAAHLPLTLEALALGLHVLGEKPLSATMGEAFTLADAADDAGLLFMVSQSRSYLDALVALRAAVGDSAPATLSQQFGGRAGEGTGFRHVMAHPLLTDMSVHHFDSARLVLGQEPVWVQCVTSNPPWSWFAGDAIAHAVFGMSDGTVYDYTGSWVELGETTSWNAQWRVSLAGGSLSWNGEDAARHTAPDGSSSELAGTSPWGEYLVGGATAFAEALHSGVEPRGAARNNIMTLAMVHAAIESAATGERVTIADFLAVASQA